MLLQAIILLAPDDELTWVIRMRRHVHYLMIYDIIGIHERRTIRALDLRDVLVVLAQFVLFR